MKYLATIALLILLGACNKVIDVTLPAYEPELVVEMYLEDGKPMRCLLTESLPYIDSALNSPINDARVEVSDGTNTYVLNYQFNEDEETGRFYNYIHTGTLEADPAKTYTLRITDNQGRVVTGSTRFAESFVPIDSLVSRPSVADADSFSVGVLFTDPVDEVNYYRFVVGRDLSDFDSDPTDFSLPDVSFNGKQFSFYSEPMYALNDTVTVRIYSMTRQHYEYRQSVLDARGANFNPFAQPGNIRSSVQGGIGIFTSILFDERKLIVR